MNDLSYEQILKLYKKDIKKTEKLIAGLTIQNADFASLQAQHKDYLSFLKSSVVNIKELIDSRD